MTMPQVMPQTGIITRAEVAGGEVGDSMAMLQDKCEGSQELE